MTRRSVVLIELCAVLVLCACSANIDKNKFQNANDAAKTLERSVAAGIAYQDLGKLLQRLSDEVTILDNTVDSRQERELAAEYSVLLGMYEDGLLLMRYQGEFSGHNFVPPGRIYVGQDVEPIVTKYRIETESHVFGPTHQTWKSISADSIRIIWYNAGQQLKKVDALLKEES